MSHDTHSQIYAFLLGWLETLLTPPPSDAPTMPKIISLSSGLTLTTEDHDFILNCSMSGNLAPDLTWYHNGEDLLNLRLYDEVLKIHF